eukprot:scaffold1554_cov261-Pinguiococcus_pyrenoidosus.AAC.14
MKLLLHSPIGLRCSRSAAWTGRARDEAQMHLVERPCYRKRNSTWPARSNEGATLWRYPANGRRAMQRPVNPDGAFQISSSEFRDPVWERDLTVVG